MSWSPEQRVCLECNAAFLTSWAQNGQQIYCSRRCKNRVRRRQARARYGHRHDRDEARGKARRLGVRYEPIDPQKVFERDGFRCGLCGRTVNRLLKGPHPKSASVDHIVPMNAQDLGDHLYQNVQCAHLECNVRKGRRGISQLRLLA